MSQKTTRDPAVEAIAQLNDSVASSFDCLDREIKGVREDVGAVSARVETAERWIGDRKARGEIVERGKAEPEGIWLRGENGTRVRALRPSDKLASIYGSDAVGAGEIVRGLATGRWTPEAQKAALSGGSTTGGGLLLTPAVSAAIVDAARARSAVVRAGALTIPMTAGEMRIAAISADPAVAWRAENQAITASDPTFAGYTLKARTLAVLTKLSIELAEDASNLEAFVEQVFAGAIAAEIDRVALVGSGAAEEPRGLQNTPSVGTATSVGSPLWEDLVDAMTTVRLANGEPTAAILSPRDVGTLGKLKGTSNDHFVQPPTVLANLPILHTTNVPRNLGGGANESLAFVGDFSNIWIGVRTQLQLEASREAGDSTGSAFGSLQIWLRGYIRLDVAVVRPSHFVVLSGLTA